jgi:DNA polymerase type B, organellar and viral
MKAKRGQFKASQRDQILKYCRQELEALVELMQAFRSCHIAAGLPALTSLYGPGAIANSLLKSHHIQNHMLATDGELNQAALRAYAAGRIERLRYGNFEGPVKIYDINSAYPYSIARLPSLKAGWKHYRHTKSKQPIEPIPMSLYRVRLFSHDRYASPLFYRKGMAKSRPIFFPNPKGTNYIECWIWTPEYENLLNLGFRFRLIEACIFQGDTNSQPFKWLQDLYQRRLEYKEAGNPAEKNLKLAYNSIYGKFVQQAGYKIKREIPKWHQIEWGGYVTSECRSRLYAAMHSINFDGVVGVETDSIIVSGDKSPEIKLTNQLGDWGVSDFDGITYIQSGVYWLKSNGEWLDKYSKGRGYTPGSLSREQVIEAWNVNPFGDSNVQENGNTLGMVVHARGNEFITLGHCFRPGQSIDEWGNWKEGPKKLSLWRTTKRAICRQGNPANQLLDTEDQTDFSGMSSPYNLEWGDDTSDM